MTATADDELVAKLEEHGANLSLADTGIIASIGRVEAGALMTAAADRIRVLSEKCALLGASQLAKRVAEIAQSHIGARRPGEDEPEERDYWDMCQRVIDSEQTAVSTEPFGYFRALPFGWEDCAADAEGAIPLYEWPHSAPCNDCVDYAGLREARAAVAAEREACADLVQGWNTAMTDKLADAIRARGEKGERQ